MFGGGTREINVILWEMAQARHIDQSSALAQDRRAATSGGRPDEPAGHSTVLFRVLVGANMRAVLVEMGYLTNAAQESAVPSAVSSRLNRERPLTEAVAQFFLAWRPSRAQAAAPAPGARSMNQRARILIAAGGILLTAALAWFLFIGVVMASASCARPPSRKRLVPP